MGRFSKPRAPAVGWPVAPPPPPEPRPQPRPADRTAPPLAAPEPRPQPRPADRTAPPLAAPEPRAQPRPANRTAPPPAARAPRPSAEPRRPTPSGPAAPRLPAPPDPAASATTDLAAPAPAATSFRDRARIRRRLRYLRQTRELAFRDLGGFVFDSRRLERPREDIVEAKLKGLLAMDRELRTLETALDERQELLLLHEPGITVCHRCATIHGSDANFCPSCGLPRQGSPLLPAPRAPLPPAPTGE